MISPGKMRQSKIVRSSSEDAIQRGIINYLRWALPKGWIVFSIPNGGSRNPIEAAKMKGTGTLAGMPDICILGCNHRGQSTYFVEVKSANGRSSATQMEMHDRLNDLAYPVGIARSIDDVRDLCLGWLIPMREAA
jgi:hypothetical protein